MIFVVIVATAAAVVVLGVKYSKRRNEIALYRELAEQSDGDTFLNQVRDDPRLDHMPYNVKQAGTVAMDTYMRNRRQYFEDHPDELAAIIKARRDARLARVASWRAHVADLQCRPLWFS